MRERLEQRLRELRAEFERGQKMLAQLETEQANVRDSLLRIGGAMQVLEEELAQEVERDSPPMELEKTAE